MYAAAAVTLEHMLIIYTAKMGCKKHNAHTHTHSATYLTFPTNFAHRSRTNVESVIETQMTFVK